MLGNRFFEPVGLLLGQGETDGLRFDFGRPGEASSWPAEGTTIDRTVTEIADVRELLAQFGVAGFQLGEVGRWHDAFLDKFGGFVNHRPYIYGLWLTPRLIFPPGALFARLWAFRAQAKPPIRWVALNAYSANS